MALAGITAHIDSALANTTDNLAFMGTLKDSIAMHGKRIHSGVALISYASRAGGAIERVASTLDAKTSKFSRFTGTRANRRSNVALKT